jgi:hypothetical protein
VPSERSDALAAFHFELSRVGQLVRLRPVPTLGEIAVALSTDLKWAPYHMLPSDYRQWRSEEYLPFLWGLADSEFGGRPDYRLWRLIAWRHPSKHLSRWPQLSESAVDALENPESIIVWGALAVLSGYLSSKRLRTLFPNQDTRLEIAALCEQRILTGLAPVRGGRGGLLPHQGALLECDPTSPTQTTAGAYLERRRRISWPIRKEPNRS